MRMIDADALIEDIDGDLTDSIAEGRAIEKIMNAPTIVDRETGMMYAVYGGIYNQGIFTVLVDADGKPLIWEGTTEKTGE